MTKYFVRNQLSQFFILVEAKNVIEAVETYAKKINFNCCGAGYAVVFNVNEHGHLQERLFHFETIESGDFFAGIVMEGMK